MSSWVSGLNTRERLSAQGVGELAVANPRHLMGHGLSLPTCRTNLDAPSKDGSAALTNSLPAAAYYRRCHHHDLHRLRRPLHLHPHRPSAGWVSGSRACRDQPSAARGMLISRLAFVPAHLHAAAALLVPVVRPILARRSPHMPATPPSQPPSQPLAAGIAVSLLFSICVIYVAADFRYPLPTPFPGDCCGSAGCTGEGAGGRG